MSCQKKIADKIIAHQADYMLSVKDNQKNLHQDLQDWFACADKFNLKECTMITIKSFLKDMVALKFANAG